MEKENQTPQNNMNALNCSNVFNPSWENAADQSGVDLFESALSSMVSSPTASNINGSVGEDVVLRELIGRLGSICNNNSGEISPHQAFNIHSSNSNNTSCYSTPPLNSPPKLNLSTMMVENYRHHIRENVNYHYQSQYSNFLPPFSADPGFAERAARFSCFANENLGGFKPQLDSSSFSRAVSSSDREQISVCDQKLKTSESVNDLGIDSTENSTASEQINGQNDTKKRKSNTRGKGKGNPPSTHSAKDAPSETSETSAKRMKSEDGNEEEPAKFIKPDSKRKQSKDDPKASEPPKDYIHVRARRGQATDAHSLAERVRREKISERMKLLQDLVPGCNKVTGKAVLLDEIINYVQSLQCQVEFLSMKMATINPRMDVNMESLVSKDVFQSLGSLPRYTYATDSFLLQSQANPHSSVRNVTDPFFQANRSSQSLSRDVSMFLEDDLHSVVQMGFQKN